MPLLQIPEEDKARIRHHMGYLEVAEAATFVLGAPAGVQTQFMIELAMNKVLVSGQPRLYQVLNILDTIEGQMVEDFELLAVDSLGDITIRKDEQEALVKRYDYWVAALANILGCNRNPFDKRLTTGQGFGNISVGN
jgi:hypothetical protein